MEPTLNEGDRLVVFCGTQQYRPGQVVVLRDPRNRGRRIVKRVVRVLGDRVEVWGDNGRSSTDSRSFGLVDASLVEGVVRYRYSPSSQAGPIRCSRVLGVEGDGSETVVSK
jgi:nickel-type superoxide dismutase maturation protease